MTSLLHVTSCFVIMATLLSMTSSSSRGRPRHQHGRRRRPTFSVEEQLPVGHLVGHVVTSQEAGGRSFSLLATHSRYIDIEKLTNNNRSLFAVDSETGIIRTATVLDREQLCATRTRTRTAPTATPRSPSCLVSLDVAVLPRFNVVTVDIEIVDINDHAPSFANSTVTRHVTESATPGAVVFQLPVAVDQDGGGKNGQVEYRLLPMTSAFRLVVDPHTGQLNVELAEPLDRETTSVNSHLSVY